MAKVENLLATLRGEEPEPEAPPPMEGGGGVVSAEALAPLEARLADLEARLAEASAPPPMDESAAAGEAPLLEEVPPLGEELPPAMEDIPPMEPPPEPPAAPTELVMFLQTKMELIEKKLEISQQEALRANLVLREREHAQHKAQREVEDLFRGIREAQRAQKFDSTLRENYSTAMLRVRELEQRLALAQLRMIPAEDVLAQMADEETRTVLAARIKEQLVELEQKTGSLPEGAPTPPTPEGVEEADVEVAVDRAKAGFESVVGPIAPDADLPQVAVLLGRVADLEGRLEEAHEQRNREAAARRHWEENILAALKTTRRQWQKAGGPELLVESALETMTDSMQERDTLQTEMTALVASISDEPAESSETPAMRVKLGELRKRMEALQDKLGKQMAIVQAWVKRDKEQGS